MTYIPVNYDLFHTNEGSNSSFKLQITIDPDLVFQRFSVFNRGKSSNYFKFGFCDESGVEYIIQCVRINADQQDWQTVVTLQDSLNPLNDVKTFFQWLADNFEIGI